MGQSGSVERPDSGPESEAGRPVVHALLVCRDVRSGEGGAVTLENVVEVVAVETLPADVGPLCFVAFVRNLPEGPGTGAFVLGAPGSGEPFGQLPLELEVPPGFGGRQLAMHVRVQSLPVRAGGWFTLGFEWEGTRLAATRFVVGARRAGDADAGAEG